MLYLKRKYISLGIIMGICFLGAFWRTRPDGKLHITYCDVGQGDAIYILFPDGRDMLVDGGPDTRVLSCLGSVMPFWDRTLDLVLLTHAEKDHFGGLTEVVKRYRVGYFLTSDSENVGPEYTAFVKALSSSHAQVKILFAGDQVTEGSVLLSFLWPSLSYIAEHTSSLTRNDVLPAATEIQNQRALVFHLRYGLFDAVFTGDADSQVDSQYMKSSFLDDTIEVLKVPHHGSKTGMTRNFVEWIHPGLAIISVGKKNPYHHPTPETLALLESVDATILRTDVHGTITIVSDGNTWSYRGEDQ